MNYKDSAKHNGEYCTTIERLDNQMLKVSEEENYSFHKTYFKTGKCTITRMPSPTDYANIIQGRKEKVDMELLANDGVYIYAKKTTCLKKYVPREKLTQLLKSLEEGFGKPYLIRMHELSLLNQEVNDKIIMENEDKYVVRFERTIKNRKIISVDFPLSSDYDLEKLIDDYFWYKRRVTNRKEAAQLLLFYDKAVVGAGLPLQHNVLKYALPSILAGIGIATSNVYVLLIAAAQLVSRNNSHLSINVPKDDEEISKTMKIMNEFFDYESNEVLSINAKLEKMKSF